MSLKSASTNASPANSRQTAIALAAILLMALAFRLGWVLVIDPSPVQPGGDALFYLSLGRGAAGLESVGGSQLLAVGPMYPLYLSLFYRALPEALVVPAARAGQAVLDTAMCLCIFDLGRRLFNTRIGLLAAAVLALDLRFVVQTREITTETVFMFFLVAGAAAFVAARDHGGISRYAGSALLLLLAAFTRAIALPLLILLPGSLLLSKPTRAQWKVFGVILALAVALAGAWSVRQYQATGQWVVVSDGFGGNFWMGSRDDGQWHGNAAFQAELEDLKLRYGGRAAYMEDALRTIVGDPVAYGQRLAVKLARAYLQPHGTVSFPGESLKDLAVHVIRGEIGFGELITGDAFWPKLIIYIFHFTGLIGGLLGLWLARRDWLKILPLTLPIAYITLAYVLLTIIPRYIFPIMPFYMLLAAYTGVEVFTRYKTSKSQLVIGN